MEKESLVERSRRLAQETIEFDAALAEAEMKYLGKSPIEYAEISAKLGDIPLTRYGLHKAGKLNTPEAREILATACERKAQKLLDMAQDFRRGNVTFPHHPQSGNDRH